MLESELGVHLMSFLFQGHCLDLRILWAIWGRQTLGLVWGVWQDRSRGAIFCLTSLEQHILQNVQKHSSEANFVVYWKKYTIPTKPGWELKLREYAAMANPTVYDIEKIEVWTNLSKNSSVYSKQYIYRISTILMFINIANLLMYKSREVRTLLDS